MNTFIPFGDTVNIAVTGTAQTLTLTVPTDFDSTLRLTNVGTQTVFVHFTTTATVNNGVPLIANTSMIFNKGSVLSLSVIASTTGSTLYATTGKGS